ncbi:MAG: cupin domain-containing protein [Clostridia bacterium]|nr:cupin domain-containing protein [Clostridia bacterium]
MTIDFNNIPEQAQEHFKGGEGTVYIAACAQKDNKIMRVRIPAEASIGMHIHETNSETYMVLQGTARVTMQDGTTETVSAGQVHHCPQGCGHITANAGPEDLILFAMVPEHG